MNQLARIAGLVTMVVMVLTGSAADAQSAADPAVDFLVTPSRVEVRARPGETIDFQVTVYNRATRTLELDNYIDDIEIPEDELIAEDDLAFTASKWASFTSPAAAVGAGANTSIGIRVEIPEGTPSGGYHAFAFIQSRPEETETGIVPSGRIGVTLLIEVSPDGGSLDRGVRVTATDLELAWDGPFNPRVSGSVGVENVGESFVVVGGVHTYRSWPGTRSSEVKVGPHTALRGTRHDFFSEAESVPIFGKVTFTSELVYQVAPDDLPVILTQATIWVIPWHLIGIVMLVAGLGWWLGRRRGRLQSGESDIEIEEMETV